MSATDKRIAIMLWGVAIVEHKIGIAQIHA